MLSGRSFSWSIVCACRNKIQAKQKSEIANTPIATFGLTWMLCETGVLGCDSPFSSPIDIFKTTHVSRDCHFFKRRLVEDNGERSARTENAERDLAGGGGIEKRGP